MLNQAVTKLDFIANEKKDVFGCVFKLIFINFVIINFLLLMAELKIFIAGSKSLKAERNGIKIIANDLSSLYGSRDIHITAHSYEHFDEDQESYNKFIVQEADIVVFIIDGFIGSKTEEEFVAATKSLRNDKHPDVMIFMHEHDEQAVTPDIARVQGLIMGCLGNGKYHIDYTTLEDLKAKAKERIMRYVDKHILSPVSARPLSKKSNADAEPAADVLAGSAKPAWVKRLGIAAVALLLVLFAFIGGKKSVAGDYVAADDEQSMLVFSGGGSVVDYIRNMTGNAVDIKKYKSSIYINLPSGSAWNLLLEEAVRWNEEKRQPFVSVILSADRIDSLQIDYKVHNIRSQACITGYFLGYDTLAVYVEKSFAALQGLSAGGALPDSLSTRDFARLVSYAKNNSNEVRMFTTNKSSGTLRMYQRVVDKMDSTVNFDRMLETGVSFPFYQDSSSDYLYMLNNEERKSYIILGSENYLAYKAKNFHKFHIYDDGIVQKKEMFIYFMSYKNPGNDEYYFSPKVLALLEELGAKKNLAGDVWSVLSQCRLPDRYGYTVLYLNE